MIRRVIKQGHSTLTITLPTKWVKMFGIKPGDELDIIEHNKSLVLNTLRDREIGEVSVDVRGLSIPLLWRVIISSYRAGYDSIKIEFDEDNKNHKGLYSAFSYNTIEYLSTNKEHLVKLSPIEAIQALVNRLIGVEIIDQKRNSCIIKEMGDTSYREFDNSLRRIFLLIKDMLSQIKEGIDGDKTGLKSIHIVDTNLDRFEDFCLRVLNKKGYIDFNKTPVMFSIVFLLEMIGDDYKEVSICLLSMKCVNKSLAKIFDSQVEIFNGLYELFYNYEIEKVKVVHDSYYAWSESVKRVTVNLNTDEKEVAEHLKKIGTYFKSLTELIINLRA